MANIPHTISRPQNYFHVTRKCAHITNPTNENQTEYKIKMESNYVSNKQNHNKQILQLNISYLKELINIHTKSFYQEINLPNSKLMPTNT